MVNPHHGAAVLRVSSPARLKFLNPEGEAIAHAWAESLRQFPVKDVAKAAGDASEDAVKAWRSLRAMPGVVRSVLIGRRIPVLAGALSELTLQGAAAGPEHHRLLAPLLAELSEIAANGDEVSRARARAALSKFAAQVGG
jgi:hypothetical protein